MKICCISDLHGTIPDIPKDIDLLLIAGDIAWHENIFKEAKWIGEVFNPWIKSLDIPTIYIGGNHDFFLESERNNPVGIYLENDFYDYMGIRIFGTPLSLEVGPWVWQAKEEDIERILKHVMCDILISHGPAYGYGDKVFPTYESIGSNALKDWIVNFQPSLVINGHIHESRGLYRLGQTIIVNCSVLDRCMIPVGKVYCIDYSETDKLVKEVTEWSSYSKEYRSLYSYSS